MAVTKGKFAINKETFLTIALASIVSGLIVVWLTPIARKTPPADYRGT